MLETLPAEPAVKASTEAVAAKAAPPPPKKEAPTARPPRNLRNKIIFALVGVGVLAALTSAYVYARPKHPLPPAFNPAANPYAKGVYANGIIESDQSNGENINLYPEIPGTVVQILVSEGQHVTKGTPLFVLDDSVQRALVEQQRSQLEAARALLDELKAQPRRETLEVARAQMEMAAASLKTAEDALVKQKRSYDLDPKSVSKDVLDNAVNAEKVARANVDVVTRQYQLTKAGAWVYDVRNQSQQVEAMSMAVASSTALLGKYTVKAPSDGVVLSILTSTGSYLSSQGAYDTYTQSYAPAMVMGSSAARLHVRCYVDEILIQRLPSADQIQAKMLIRGTDVSVPLEFVRVQPYVSPKIQLSNERTERVDLRVLPIIFRFTPPTGVALYPGEMVDVYVASK
jgi:HlyD family secretion protein